MKAKRLRIETINKIAEKKAIKQAKI